LRIWKLEIRLVKDKKQKRKDQEFLEWLLEAFGFESKEEIENFVELEALRSQLNDIAAVRRVENRTPSYRC